MTIDPDLWQAGLFVVLLALAVGCELLAWCCPAFGRMWEDLICGEPEGKPPDDDELAGPVNPSGE